MAVLNDLTISVVSHAHGKLLDLLLEDLKNAGALERCRVVVTVNVDDPNFPAEKWHSKNIEWIRNKKPKGFGENHNFVLAGAKTEWLLILNPDIRLPARTLEDMLLTLPDPVDIGIIAPRIVSPAGSVEDSVRHNISPISLFIRAFRKLLVCNPHSSHPPKVSGDWFAGMFLLMPSRVFQAVNGFDERYFLYCEDCDLCIRVSLLGKRLILDDRYSVVHDAQRKSHRHLKYLRWHLRSLLVLWFSRTWWIYIFRRKAGRLSGVERVLCTVTGHSSAT